MDGCQGRSLTLLYSEKCTISQREVQNVSVGNVLLPNSCMGHSKWERSVARCVGRL